nr:MAG TPA: Replication associated protein [Microviridae sp.]
MSDKVRNFFNRCEHPRIIKNKYTGEPVYVECGVCPHCLISRSDAKRNLCDYEKWNRKYCYFVTLTYNSQYVPKMALEPITDYEFDYPVGKNWPAVRSQLRTRMLLDSRVKKEDNGQVINMYTCKVNFPYIDEHLRDIYASCAAATEFRNNYKPVYQSLARPYILRTIPRISKLQNFKDIQREELVWISPEQAEMLKKKSKCEGNDNAFPQFKGLLKYVNYRDYQLFAKRFRKYLFTKIGSYEKISSYVVSEYSPRTFRPHFHILFFFDSDEVAKNIRQAVFQSWKLGRVDTQLARDSAGSYVSGYLNSVVSLPRIFTDVFFTKNKSRFSKLFGYESFRKTVEVPEQAVERLSERIRFVRNGKPCEFAPPLSYISRLLPRFVPYSSNFAVETRTVLRSIRGVLQLFRRNEPFKEETPTNLSEFIHCYIVTLYEKYGYCYATLPECMRIFLAYTRTEKEIHYFTDSLKNKLSRPFYIYKRFLACGLSDDYLISLCDEYMSRQRSLSLSKQLSIQQEMFEREGYSDDLLSLFYINKPQKKINNRYFQEWKDKNYYEVHYIRVKHKKLNDENNVFLE